jgi:hypothetical protein
MWGLVITKERTEEIKKVPRYEDAGETYNEFQDLCQLALQAMNAKMPTSEEVDVYLKANKADKETIISKACDAGFKAGVKWFQERMGR